MKRIEEKSLIKILSRLRESTRGADRIWTDEKLNIRMQEHRCVANSAPVQKSYLAPLNREAFFSSSTASC